MPYLQIVNGKYRVRIVVPPELRPYLPPPHTGKANLTRALGTGNEREAPAGRRMLQLDEHEPERSRRRQAPKKGNQDMEAKCGRFAEWLGHDDTARVGFENCRDYRDAMIDEGDSSSGSILNRLSC
jgi:hypothetical protein